METDLNLRHSDEVGEARYHHIAVPRRRCQSSPQPAISADARYLRRISVLKSTLSMSGITENSDCDDCNYPAHGGNCTGSRVHSTMDEDDELLRYIWTEYLHPKEYEWVLIVAYIVVFFVSLIGNSLGDAEACRVPVSHRAAECSTNNMNMPV
ncbi:hypothetical protein CRENBAI_007637 [Crenichthys baileyi]|uniref:Orexin receptor type 2 n=1 Tax=Crenichthys baileyi TaxID=28760 RepID=A0AAV9SKS7_9TELE